MEGMALYREHWKGSIIFVCEPDTKLSDNLDNIEVDIDKAPFQTICEEFSEARLRQLLDQRCLVLASVGEKFNNISALCRTTHNPCVYIAEYNLRTRLQIIKEYQPSNIHGLWRSWKQVAQERAQVHAISLADGIQCNGTPTYLAYKDLTPEPLLFFDTRFPASSLATTADLLRKEKRLQDERILHLAFSGRLARMKGAHHLPSVAAKLRALGVRFRMFICGDGELKSEMEAQVSRQGLRDLVLFKGTLDFHTQLIPFMKTVDLFVCCHVQGDPSCTYLETMACGVPIAGYANDAFRGIFEKSNVGWLTPIGKSAALAECIAGVSRDISTLKKASLGALDFARGHTFEETFRQRVEHMERVLCGFQR
jgi:glycosyltransferase involved in cell wall biosynthesis